MHTGPLRAIVIDQTGKYAYTGGYDKRVYKWDLNSGSSYLLTEHEHLVGGLTLSKDGGYLLTSSSDYSMKLIDTKTESVIKTFLGHTDDIEYVIFAEDDQYIISTSLQHDGRVLVWNVENGNIIREFNEHKSSVKSVWTFNNKVFSCDNNGNVLVWNLITGEVLDNLGPYTCDIDTINGDINRGILLIGLDNGDIDVYDALKHTKMKTLKGHKIGVKTIEISPSGNYVLTAAYDHQIFIWDRNFKRLSSLPQYKYQWEVGFAFSKDEKNVYGCTFGYKFCEWEWEKNQLIDNNITCATPSINDIAVSENGNVATASDDGVFRLNGEKIMSVNHVLNNAVGMTNDGSIIAWGDHKGYLHLVDAELKTMIKSIDFSSGPLNSIVYDREHHSFFIGSYSGNVFEINLYDFSIVDQFRAHNGAIKGMVVEREFIATGSSGGEVHIFNRKNISECIRLVGSSFVINDLSYNEKKNLLATVSRDRIVRIYDASNGSLKGLHNMHNYSVKTVCFNASGVLFAGDYWGYISVWDLNDDKKNIFKVANNGISYMEKLGEEVLAGSYDGGVYSVNKSGENSEFIRLFDQSENYHVLK
ncbi:WD40 repeat domain-containing protein [Bacillus altitudinis]|uniref:WD40 repeat domain-containing protein n=1 Tax=Bacillus TaxID=1386 RepID=UPI00227EE20D|nr:WD40 repeat domain-containing protein [Bacillus altitudinis]MCY7578512.1 WD40 repeat domain-containing protein [Bacillus altitudinis]MCY7596095.1 WD40 repeat domain-containing protein [Bacillus altitudinis]WJE31460.1 WD40 repeat domain-containing protein [Bacillus altitudinis]WQH40009.1 WD40 repeat domain-containing protein [Bacillus altitudinis]